MDQFERILKGKITELLNSRIDLLSQFGAKDYAQYTQYCGYVEALRHVLELCDEAHKDLRGD